jgi:hypothetical protein
MQAARYAFGLCGIHDEDEARDITAGVTVGDARAPVAMPRVITVEEETAKADETPAVDPVPDLPY